MSFGIGGLLYQHVLDKSAITLDQPDDMAVLGEKERKIMADALFGLNFTREGLHVGLSVPQIFQTKLDFSESENDQKMSKLVRHYFLTAGYKFQLNADFYLDPSLLVKAVTGAPPQVDVNVKVHYTELLWGGVSYRHNDAVVILLGVHKNNFLVGYSYDATLSSIRKYSTGTHEILIGLNFPKDMKKSKASY